MITKECKKCGYNVPIRFFELRCSGIEYKPTCTMCRKPKNKVSYIYPTEEMQQLSIINNIIIESKLSKYKEKKKRHLLYNTIDKTCKICNNIIKRNNKNNKIYCDKCREIKRTEKFLIREKKVTKDLKERYIKKLLKKEIDSSKITSELIEIKRKQLKLKRGVKEQKNKTNCY